MKIDLNTTLTFGILSLLGIIREGNLYVVLFHYFHAFLLELGVEQLLPIFMLLLIVTFSFNQGLP